MARLLLLAQLLFLPAMALALPPVSVEQLRSDAPRRLSRTLFSDFSVKLNCAFEENYIPNDEFILAALSSAGIKNSGKSRYELKLVMTDYLCDAIGEDSRTQYPIGLAYSRDNFALARMRILYELVDRRTGKLLGANEVSSTSQMERKEFKLFQILLEKRKAVITERDLVVAIAEKVAALVKADLERLH